VGTAHACRNGGEDIGQALALMGVRPVWDWPTGALVGLEVIPLSLLQRWPRVDVHLRHLRPVPRWPFSIDLGWD